MNRPNKKDAPLKKKKMKKSSLKSSSFALTTALSEASFIVREMMLFIIPRFCAERKRFEIEWRAPGLGDVRIKKIVYCV